VHVSVCANVDLPLVLCKRMVSVRRVQFYCFDLAWHLSRFFEC